MHTRKVHPAKEWRPSLGLFRDEVRARLSRLVVDSLHPLNVQWASVLDLAIRKRVEDAARVVTFKEIGIVTKPIGTFGLLFGVEVVQVAEELIEAVFGRQKFVTVAEVILAKLSRSVAKRLQCLRNRDVPCLQTLRRARDSYLGQPCAPGGLPRNKRRASRSAAILRIVIGEQHPFLRNAIDVRRVKTHHPQAVSADVRLTNIITEDDKDVRLLCLPLSNLRHEKRPEQHQKGCQSKSARKSSFNPTRTVEKT